MSWLFLAGHLPRACSAVRHVHLHGSPCLATLFVFSVLAACSFPGFLSCLPNFKEARLLLVVVWTVLPLVFGDPLGSHGLSVQRPPLLLPSGRLGDFTQGLRSSPCHWRSPCLVLQKPESNLTLNKQVYQYVPSSQ